MSSDEGGRRPKRRCARSRLATSALPSAVHYVGYVEDDETPEMIMAKFIELERIQQMAQDKAKQTSAPGACGAHPLGQDDSAAAGGTAEEDGSCTAASVLQQQPAAAAAGAYQALTDEQLMEVFKQTSMFNVKTALEDNNMLLSIDDWLDATEDRYGSDEDFSEGEDFVRAFWSDDEDLGDMEMYDDEGERYGKPRRGAGGRARGAGLPRQVRNAASVKARHNVVTTFNAATQALIRRKVKVVDPDEIVQLRVPPAPIPLAWGRTVKPYVPEELRGQRSMAVPCVVEATPEEAATHYCEAEAVVPAAKEAMGGAGAPFQAALISPGWWEAARGQEGEDGAVQRLSRLPLPKLVPTGFIFIWVPKQHIHQVCRLMNRWGYIYVENLTWVWLHPSSNILRLPSPAVQASHLTLFIFRKEGEGRDIELRHQRNPDVTFDCLAREPNDASSVPEEAFVAIETLLPTGKGRFLELWAPQGVRRPGWTHIAQAGAAR